MSKFKYIYYILGIHILGNIIYYYIFFRFYIECLLPEIIDPLYGKRISISDIREPKHILNAQKKKNKKL